MEMRGLSPLACLWWRVWFENENMFPPFFPFHFHSSCLCDLCLCGITIFTLFSYKSIRYIHWYSKQISALENFNAQLTNDRACVLGKISRKKRNQNQNLSITPKYYYNVDVICNARWTYITNVVFKVMRDEERCLRRLVATTPTVLDLKYITGI